MTSFQKTIIIENGGGIIKAGYGGQASPVIVAPNCSARIKSSGAPGTLLVADETSSAIRNSSQLLYLRPCDRGYLVNWHVEAEVWGRILSRQYLDVTTPSEHRLLVTVPPFNPQVLQEDMTEVVFEEYGFGALAQVPAQKLAAFSVQSYWRRPCLVVDSGFSFTHAFPVVQGKAVRAGVRRLNVGGKLLTNYLKEMISYRQWNMMDDFRLVNEVKEALSYVSLDFSKEMEQVKRSAHTNGISKEFVLPDYQTTMKGYVRDPVPPQAGQIQQNEQVLRMGNERFCVGEVLFRPSDIGLGQAGLAETIAQSIKASPPEFQGLLCSNILVVGGNSLMPNFKERLFRELRPLVSEHYEVNVNIAEDPVCHSWKMGSNCSAQYGKFATDVGMVNKVDYEEHGHNICNKKFEEKW